MKQKTRRPKRANSDVSEADLLKIERTKARRMDRPRTLPLSEVHVADKVFQWRNRNENIAPSMRHLEELTRVLKTTKKPLDPIVVTPVGRKFYLLEGHHRVEAYRAAGWRREVPVKHFEGNVVEAQDEALRLNIKDKLPMSRAEKFDAAFRLVRRGKKTYPEIREITTVSVRTLATMAEVLRVRPDAAELSWNRARALQFKKDEQQEGDLDWQERKAQKLAEQLVHNVGPGFVRDADITARALEIIDGDLPKALVNQWFETAMEVVLDNVREENPELADGLLRAFAYPTGAMEYGDADDL